LAAQTGVKGTKAMKKIFSADMWAIYNFAEANDRYEKFINSNIPALKRFVESILLYDVITIPTQDFMGLTVLINLFGKNCISQLLEEQSLSFTRVKGGISYAKSQGVYPLGIKDGDTGIDKPFCGSTESALVWSQSGINKNESGNKKSLTQKVLSMTREVDLKEIIGDIKLETSKDILKSQTLRSLFGFKSTDLDNLEMGENKKTYIFPGVQAFNAQTDLDVLLAITQANLELCLMGISDSQDMSTTSPVGHLLSAKYQRSDPQPIPFDSFSYILEIDDIPDFSQAVLHKQLDLKKIINLRNSKNAIEFRRWFHENCRTDPLRTTKEYIKLIKQVPAIESRLVKTIRFFVTQGLGLIPIPGVGQAVSTIDSFILERFFRGKSPKFFIDKLRQVAHKATKIPSK